MYPLQPLHLQSNLYWLLCLVNLSATWVQKFENRKRDIEILHYAIRHLECNILDSHTVLFIPVRINEEKEVTLVGINFNGWNVAKNCTKAQEVKFIIIIETRNLHKIFRNLDQSNNEIVSSICIVSNQRKRSKQRKQTACNVELMPADKISNLLKSLDINTHRNNIIPDAIDVEIQDFRNKETMSKDI